MANKSKMPRKRIGVRSKLDTQRLSVAVSRPGIDPRRWLEMGEVLDVGYDPEHGVFADVKLYSDQQTFTAFVASAYAGRDHGMLYKPKVGDVVVCAILNGDESAGLAILARLWNASAPPPPEFGDDTTAEPTDVTDNPTLVVEPGRTLRIVSRDGASIRIEASGSGNVEVVASGAAQVKVTCESTVLLDCPDVRLGDAPASQVARIGDLVVGATPPCSNGGGPVVPAGVPLASGGIPVVGQIVSGSRAVKA